MNTKRLFVAVNLPEKTKESIERELLGVLPEKEVKKVERENLHITMKFLGHLPEADIPRIAGKIKCVGEFSPFEARLEGIGHFNKRVIWLGVREGGSILGKISEKINEALGLTEERFHAHVTIARNRHLKFAEVGMLLEKLREAKFSEGIRIKSVDLMESRLGKKGPKYFVVEKIGLSP